MSQPLPLSAAAEEFLAENALCTLTTLRPDGTPHVAPVRFTWDGEAGLARVMTTVHRRKSRNLLARAGGRAAVCQLVGPRWITLEGPATVSTDPPRWWRGCAATPSGTGPSRRSPRASRSSRSRSTA